MKRVFTPATRREVLGHVVDDHPHINRILHRTPLYIDLDEVAQGPESATAHKTSVTGDPASFNAVGSRVDNGARRHLPVIKVEGGAIIQRDRGSKAILRTVSERHYDSPGEIPSYDPGSQLRDVLGDNGIGLEIFELAVAQYKEFSGRIDILGKRVTAVVLRTKEDGTFDVADPEQEGHSHVYIQRAFSESDHTTLITELGNIGIISPTWQQFTEQEGMGIVLAPWAEKN